MYDINMAIAGYAEVSADVLDLAREHAFATGESTVCLNVQYSLSNLDPDHIKGPGGELRELLARAARMGVCDLMLSE